MTGEDCKNYINSVIKDDTNQFDYVKPTVMLYAASPVEPYEQTPCDFNTLMGANWNYLPPPESKEDSDYFELRDEVDVRELQSELFLWLAGMGEYPETLAQICPAEIVGDEDTTNEDDRFMFTEKCIAQVLRWVLGEI